MSDVKLIVELGDATHAEDEFTLLEVLAVGTVLDLVLAGEGERLDRGGVNGETLQLVARLRQLLAYPIYGGVDDPLAARVRAALERANERFQLHLGDDDLELAAEEVLAAVRSQA